MTSLIKRLIPRAVKVAVRDAQRERVFNEAIGRVLSLREGETPSSELLSRLAEGWGDDGFRAVGGYLEEVSRRAVETAGPVLEIGSGLTTLLLGILAGRRGVAVWSLEHLPEFHSQTRSKLDRHGIQNVHLALSPIRSYGEFSWYAPPLETMPKDFRLVIADGPPAETPGGRFGLLPVMKSYFSGDVVILLDDAERESEQTVLREWADRYGVQHKLGELEDRAWAICSLS